MASFEHLFIKSRGGFEAEAAELAETLAMDLVRNDEGLWLNRGLTVGDGVVGGQVYANTFSEPDPDPSEIQAFDGYETVFAIRVLPRKASDQRREALSIFDELCRRRPATAMLLTHDLDLVVAAYLPEKGTHVFEDEPTVDSGDAEEWLPWVARS